MPKKPCKGDGNGCRCMARGQSECGCSADWTPSEVYKLKALNIKLQIKQSIMQERIDCLNQQVIALKAEIKFLGEANGKV